MNILSDPAAEKAVLSACYRYGKEVYFDIVDLILPSTFTVEYNEILFCCLRHIFDVLELDKPDIATLHSAANDLGLAHKIRKSECAIHIKQIVDFECERQGARKLAGKIRKLEIARSLYKRLEDTKDNILEITGNENISSILGIAENSVLDFSHLINSDSDDPRPMDEVNTLDHIQEIIQNPVSQIGISSGFKRWDACIGGGLRKGSINLIGARTGGFKSGIAITVADFVVGLGIPVLYLDTEMSYADLLNRRLAARTSIGITDIETGQFTKSEFQKSQIYQTINKLKQEPAQVFYRSIAGTPFEEQLSIIRRWLFKKVGVHGDSSANPCLVIYDYIKLMSADVIRDMKEYQAFGFLMTYLHDFCVKYKIPILGFIQLNRDGIDREGTEVISQSDRIGWLCSNFSIFKKKDAAEIEMDGEEGGNYKLVPQKTRHGPGIEKGDYINFHVKKWCMQISEGRLKTEIAQEKESMSIDEQSVDM